MIRRALAILATAAVVTAQAERQTATPTTTRPTPQSPLEVAARTRLTALAEARAQTDTMRCDYVQERSSALTLEPLRSTGTLRFRRDPACVVFAVTTPRPAEIRLDRTSYQVFEPAERRCERFELATAASGHAPLADALFDALAVRIDALLDAFEVVAIDAVPARGADGTVGTPAYDVIRLRPRDPVADPAARATPWLRTLELHVVPSDSTLRAVAYTDGQGDAVTLTFSKVEFDPVDLTADAFDAAVPDGTRVVTRRAGGPRHDR